MISDIRWVDMIRFSLVAPTGKGAPPSFGEPLRSQGVRVGLFTSPHMNSFSERIRIDGAPLPHEELVNLTHEIVPLVSRSGDHSLRRSGVWQRWRLHVLRSMSLSGKSV